MFGWDTQRVTAPRLPSGPPVLSRSSPPPPPPPPVAIARSKYATTRHRSIISRGANGTSNVCAPPPPWPHASQSSSPSPSFSTPHPTSAHALFRASPPPSDRPPLPIGERVALVLGSIDDKRAADSPRTYATPNESPHGAEPGMRPPTPTPSTLFSAFSADTTAPPPPSRSSRP